MKRFIDCGIPFEACNLRCNYCYVAHTQGRRREHLMFLYDAEHIGRALSIERLGGVCLFNICGEGETLLPLETTRIIRSILNQGHYVMVVTNGTITERFDEIAMLPPEWLNRLLVKFSYHYLELKKRGLLNVFFGNVQKIKSAGGSISVELTPSDEMIPNIDEATVLCRARTGAVCHFTVARDGKNPKLPILTQYSREQYKEIWGKFDSELFNFKMRVFGEHRHEFCYAGLWSATLNLATGDLLQCYAGEKIQNVFEDIECPIKFSPIGRHCRQPHCFNAHAFMTLGVIPAIKTPSYADMRNRRCVDGSEWLTSDMKGFVSKRLVDHNAELSRIQIMLCEFVRAWKKSRIRQKMQSTLAKTHRVFQGK